ncbi:nucleotide disphospho-sugar-binding domain-containing protein [Actinospica robiniae]|uniref:nucleotide disphospho-sugar-binding domain-containing protein n=1 Tax=Actinospica robiniae TaxID=304901 RepID=UPI000555C42F|nr:nucleotide disphospho-sugar-binding domain-containing protein [Actinospica robiniae]
MVPLLWSLRNAGHEVLIAAGGPFRAVAASSGLSAASVGDGPGLGEITRVDAAASTQQAGVDALAQHVVDFYVPTSERHTPGVVALAERWRPDLVITSEWEYAGPIAAARLGIPTVVHGWGLATPGGIDAPAARALEPLHQSWGLPDGVPGPIMEIDICPPGLQKRDYERPIRHFGWAPYHGTGIVPDWLLAEPKRPRVCVTLGNVPIKGDHGSVLASVIEGLRGLDLEIVVAAGARLEAQDLPGDVRLVRDVPLNWVLPHCELVVHHGGAGSVLASLAHGIPALVVPLMCVQYQQADRVAEVGAGISLHSEQLTAQSVAQAAAALRKEERFHTAVTGLRRQMLLAPSTDQTVRFIEDAVATDRSVLAGVAR